MGRLGIKLQNLKWPDEPIKALSVYYSYDIKVLHENNVIERLDRVKKITNIILVFERSFYLWKSNNYQVFNHTKTCLHFFVSASAQGKR